MIKSKTRKEICTVICIVLISILLIASAKQGIALWNLNKQTDNLLIQVKAKESIEILMLEKKEREIRKKNRLIRREILEDKLKRKKEERRRQLVARTDEYKRITLEKIDFAEVGNQPIEAKVAVLNVIQNRLASPKFPNDLNSVLNQRGQFETVNKNGEIVTGVNRRVVKPEDVTNDCKRAYQRFKRGENPIGERLFFCNRECLPEQEAKNSIIIGDMAFY